VVVVATSDEPALDAPQAAYLTLSIAEYFRDEGKDVLALMDRLRVLRWPSARSAFRRASRRHQRLYAHRLHRASPASRARRTQYRQRHDHGLFTVLVDGDDHNEPVADAVRGILDGHIVMERAIADRGRYPAVNVLKSISRTMPRSCDPEYWPAVQQAKRLLSIYGDMEELIRLGAYRAGSNAETDEAIRLFPALEAFLSQGKEEATNLGEGYGVWRKL